MRNLTARILVTLLAWLFPTKGKHRAPELETDTQPAAPPMPEEAPEVLPPHVQEHYRTLRGEDIDLVRPYVTDSAARWIDPARVEQAVRRWVLDMALRGIDVGPTVIHGVHVRPDARAIRVAVA
ncbi:hypothetical protein [Streptomyces lydicamycinicus]|uniref:hypothetical protein n=1 Tax=Streptomyces lydicamycinicus TaxID=1546107 RepID=UPI003C2B96BB